MLVASVPRMFVVCVNVPAPLVNGTVLDGMKLISTPPLTPTAPVWMCASVIDVSDGNPCMVTTAVPTALVTAPVASFVVTNVMVTLPEATDSLFVIGGVSFAGSSCSVNVGFTGAGGVGAD